VLDRAFCAAENYSMIKAAVIKLIEDEFPDALANASYTITDADASIRPM
jgi:hypothetical protein